ncbi:hypothetical protein BG006_001021 [Podila minutissima]|uniref:Uncharacterized protein n=1 Tax=Podila minutissima TaxID=64525 RepID=A0A9P5SSG0_9FUNG|nr:hypothetical protein BG006_001021 [Podila minutissima]
MDRHASIDVYDKSSVSTASRRTADEGSELQHDPAGAKDPDDVLASSSSKQLPGVTPAKMCSGENNQSPIVILRSASVTSNPKTNVSSAYRTVKEMPKKSTAQKDPPKWRTDLHATVADSSILRQGDASNGENQDTLDEKAKDKAKLDIDYNNYWLKIQASASMKGNDTVSDPIPDERSTTHTVEKRQQSKAPIQPKKPPPRLAPRPAIQPNNPATERNIEQREEPTQNPIVLQQSVVSSSISIHSASPTVVSTSSYPGTMTQLQKRTSTLSTTTTLTIFTAAGPSQSQPRLSLGLDVDHFRIVFKELETLTERLQDLNEQIIEALTLYPLSIQNASNSNLAAMESLTDSPDEGIAPPEPPASTLASSASSTSSDSSTESDSYIIAHKYTREEKGKDKAGIDPQEEQLIIAQSLTNLVESAWPRIYRIPTEPQTPQMIKDRIKIITKLKNAIVVFWSIQSHFYDQVQLILDLYQDPAQFEREDQILLLKSRHLDNLLSNPEISPARADYLLAKFRADQDRLAPFSERLQSVWLGILMLLGDSHQTRTLSRAHEIDVGSHHWNSGHQHHQSSSSFMSSLSIMSTGGRRCFRLSGNKCLALKVSVLMLVGAGMIGMALMISTKDPAR